MALSMAKYIALVRSRWRVPNTFSRVNCPHDPSAGVWVTTFIHDIYGRTPAPRNGARRSRDLPYIRHRFDFDLQTRVHQCSNFNQGRGGSMLAEILDPDRINERPLGNIGHEDGDLDDLRGARSRVAQAGIHAGQRNAELLDGALRNGAVCIDAD